MGIYPSERRSRRYVEQDDEEGFPRGGGSRAKGRRGPCHSPTRFGDSLTCPRTCRKTSPSPSLSVCYHYARRPYKSRPAYRGRCHKLELTRQNFELTPETHIPFDRRNTVNFLSLQVLLRKALFEEAVGLVSTPSNRFAVALI